MQQKMIKTMDLVKMLGYGDADSTKQNSKYGFRKVINLLKKIEEKKQVKLIHRFGKYNYVFRAELESVLPEIFAEDSKGSTDEQMMELKRKNHQLTQSLNRVEMELAKVQKDLAKLMQMLRNSIHAKY